MNSGLEKTAAFLNNVHMCSQHMWAYTVANVAYVHICCLLSVSQSWCVQECSLISETFISPCTDSFNRIVSLRQRHLIGWSWRAFIIDVWTLNFLTLSLVDDEIFCYCLIVFRCGFSWLVKLYLSSLILCVTKMFFSHPIMSLTCCQLILLVARCSSRCFFFGSLSSSSAFVAQVPNSLQCVAVIKFSFLLNQRVKCLVSLMCFVFSNVTKFGVVRFANYCVLFLFTFTKVS